jgi:hypothetical protein
MSGIDHPIGRYRGVICRPRRWSAASENPVATSATHFLTLLALPLSARGGSSG